MMTELDPLAVDRGVRETAQHWRRWRRSLRRGTALDTDPFVFDREVAGRTLFQRVSELPDADPLRQPLRRWIYRLAEQRINLPWLIACTFERRLRLHGVERPETSQLSLAAMLHRALASRAQRSAWLDSALEVGEGVVRCSTLLWERRREIAVRMGLDTPDALELPCPEMAAVADEWLQLSDELVQTSNSRSPAEWLGAALGEDASEGWPSRLDETSLRGLLAEGGLLYGLDLDPGPLPRAYAASSFVRGLARVGAAWAEAAAPPDQPFVVAHDPYGSSRRNHGALFALLPLNPSFVRRRLHLGERDWAKHRRALARVILLESRASALRVILRANALAGAAAWREAFPPAVERALGVGLHRSCPGLLGRLHLDDGQRFASLLLAPRRALQLTESHDEDWFRNPRAVDQLRSEAALPPQCEVPADRLREGTVALRRNLLAALS
jgi:hypothetical protein